MTQTATKERGLICTAEQVRLFLNGATQFRRVVNRLSGLGQVTEFQRSDTEGYDWQFRDKRMLWNDIGHDQLMDACPYGVPGDRLYVRETWSASSETQPIHRPCPDSKLWYRADNDRPTWAETKWKPSIHMPRWASRITLEVKRVWVERVQEISEADAIAEGCPHSGRGTLNSYGAEILETCHEWFIRNWNSINAANGYGWDANPWCWCVEIERVEARS